MVDELDLKILAMLEEDGRQPFTEMAKKLKMSESTIRKRVQALQTRGVIKRFTVEIEPSKIGMKTISIVGFDVEPTRLLDISERLCEFEEIRSVATSAGDHMIMTEIWTRDGRALTKLISERIGKIEDINKICPAIILEKLKS